MASRPVVAVSTVMPRRSRTLDSAKMLRASSSTSSTVRPTRSSSEELSRSSMRCFSGGRSVTILCRNSAVSSSRRSGDSTPLTTIERAMVCKRRVFLRRQFPAGEYDNRQFGEFAVFADALQHIEAGHIRQFEIENHAIVRRLAQCLESRSAGIDGDDLDIVVTEQFGDAHALGCIVFHHQEAFAARLRIFLDARDGGFDALRSSSACSRRRKRRARARADDPRRA